MLVVTFGIGTPTNAANALQSGYWDPMEFVTQSQIFATLSTLKVDNACLATEVMI